MHGYSDFTWKSKKKTGISIVLLGHDGAINSVGWSHNKKWLVSASEDKTVRIWSVCNTEPALLLVMKSPVC